METMTDSSTCATLGSWLIEVMDNAAVYHKAVEEANGEWFGLRIWASGFLPVRSSKLNPMEIFKYECLR